MNSKRWARKLQGVFYTKPFIVDFIVQTTLDSFLSKYHLKMEKAFRAHDETKVQQILEIVMNLKVLDPACGDGIFLNRCLLSFHAFYQAYNGHLNEEIHSSLSPITSPHSLILLNNICGVDADLNAIQKARARLKGSLKETIPKDVLERLLGLNLKCGHSLLPGITSLNLSGLPAEGKQLLQIRMELKKSLSKGNFNDFFRNHSKYEEKTQEIRRSQLLQLSKLVITSKMPFTPFFWNLEFPEIINDGGFDFIIGNPPYIRVHKQDKLTRNFLQKNYFSAKFDFDIYTSFIELSLYLLKQNGILSFITSDKFLVRKYAKNLRQLILCNAQLEELVDISRCSDSFTASTYPVIFRLQKKTQEVIPRESITNKFDGDISILRIIKSAENGLRSLGTDLEDTWIHRNVINQNDLYSSPNYEFRIHSGPLTSLLGKKIGNIPKLSSFLSKREVFCGTPRAKDYHGWKRFIIEEDPPAKPHLKFLVCRNLTPYLINFGGDINAFRNKYRAPYFVYHEDAMTLDRWNRFKTHPKVLIRGNDRRITAVLDEEGAVFIGIYGIIQDAFDPRYLVGILNSRLINAWFFEKNPSIRIRGAFFSINSTHILDLPVVVPSREIEKELVSLVQELITTQKKGLLKQKQESDQILKNGRELIEKINSLIYILYGISGPEREIIEKSLPAGFF